MPKSDCCYAVNLARDAIMSSSITVDRKYTCPPVYLSTRQGTALARDVVGFVGGLSTTSCYWG
jgi:hypothetical protein